MAHPAECPICLVAAAAEDSSSNSFILACGCRNLHYNCLVAYLQTKIGDRLAMSARGEISCPNGVACANLAVNVSLLELEYIVKYGEENPGALVGANNIDPLTHGQIADLRTWLREKEDLETMRAWLDDARISRDEMSSMNLFLQQRLQQTGSSSTTTPVPTDHDEQLLLASRQHLEVIRREDAINEIDPYVRATTKQCPSCSMCSTHYHGHQCHHISPHGGCPSCRINYCYRCLATEIENLAERGNPIRCKCGFWSNYCLPIRSAKDIQAFIVPSPVPYDKRCGCVICPDCLHGQPCETCPGNCVVCLGYMSPGPREILADGAYKLQGPGDFFGLDEPLPLLQEACRHGDTATSREILQRRQTATAPPFDINHADDDGQTVLYYACDAGHIECASLLLEYCPDVDVNRANRYGYSPLIVACKDGFAALAKVLLSTGRALANLQSSNGYTALYVACCNGHVEAVQLLLAHDKFDPPIDVNLADRTGHTPIIMAAKNGHLAIVRLLLEQSTIDVIRTSMYGSTACLWAETNHHTEIVTAIKLKTHAARSASLRKTCRIA